MLRPSDLLKRSAALEVQVDPGSPDDADRDFPETTPLPWTTNAVEELLSRLEREDGGTWYR
jgi:hypothetical protein